MPRFFRDPNFQNFPPEECQYCGEDGHTARYCEKNEELREQEALEQYLEERDIF